MNRQKPPSLERAFVMVFLVGHGSFLPMLLNDDRIGETQFLRGFY